jgi:hypothetical protein
MINNGPVTWMSHKQSSVALSTMEAEYMLLSDASREAIASQNLFDNLCILINTPFLHLGQSSHCSVDPTRSSSTLYNINARCTSRFDITLFIKPLKMT